MRPCEVVPLAAALLHKSWADTSPMEAETEEVNKSISVLLRAGMSTPDLRAASGLGVDVEGAGVSKTAYLAIKWPISLFYVAIAFARHDPLCRVLAVALAVLEVTFAAIAFTAPQDRRAFAIKLAHMMFVAGLPVLGLLSLAIGERLVPMTVRMQQVAGFMLIPFMISVCIGSTLGIHRIARIPVIGVPLAQRLATRGKRSQSQLPKQNVFPCASSSVV